QLRWLADSRPRHRAAIRSAEAELESGDRARRPDRVRRQGLSGVEGQRAARGAEDAGAGARGARWHARARSGALRDGKAHPRGGAGAGGRCLAARGRRRRPFAAPWPGRGKALVAFAALVVFVEVVVIAEIVGGIEGLGGLERFQQRVIV